MKGLARGTGSLPCLPSGQAGGSTGEEHRQGRDRRENGGFCFESIEICGPTILFRKTVWSADSSVVWSSDRSQPQIMDREFSAPR